MEHATPASERILHIKEKRLFLQLRLHLQLSQLLLRRTMRAVRHPGIA